MAYSVQMFACLEIKQGLSNAQEPMNWAKLKMYQTYSASTNPDPRFSSSDVMMTILRILVKVVWLVKLT